MVCAKPGAAATLNERVTGDAAANEASPIWLAVKLQVPLASNVIAVPDTEHTAGVLEVMVTLKPELELAVKAAVVVPSVWLPGDANVMV
jgi:hypothetical protein